MKGSAADTVLWSRIKPDSSVCVTMQATLAPTSASSGTKIAVCTEVALFSMPETVKLENMTSLTELLLDCRVVVFDMPNRYKIYGYQKFAKFSYLY